VLRHEVLRSGEAGVQLPVNLKRLIWNAQNMFHCQPHRRGPSGARRARARRPAAAAGAPPRGRQGPEAARGVGAGRPWPAPAHARASCGGSAAGAPRRGRAVRAERLGGHRLC
jgi:hypothetical protein